jgi:hypothetical protein
LGLQRRPQPEMEPWIGRPKGGHSSWAAAADCPCSQGVLAECRIALSACTAVAANQLPSTMAP